MLKNFDIVVRDMVKEGKDVNDVLAMPFHYVLQILDERHTNKVTSDAKADALFAKL
ncbi:MAG: phage tail assembly chaperone GT [Staphylococcus simulans]|uniref:phage tail assembly chaperone GT n=1 Tax=Staphylococcus sp. HMSC12H08 TaxID=1581092 RepID=UPI0037DA6BA8